MTPTDFLRRYANTQAGAFTVRGFRVWARSKGLAHDTSEKLIAAAFDELTRDGTLEQVTTPPGSLIPLFRRRGQ